MSCIAQVWDNGDMTSCDKPTKEGVRFCFECAQRKLTEAWAQFHQADLARLKARKEMAVLLEEIALP